MEYFNSLGQLTPIQQFNQFLNLLKQDPTQQFNQNLTELWTYEKEKSLDTVLQEMIQQNLDQTIKNLMTISFDFLKRKHNLGMIIETLKTQSKHSQLKKFSEIDLIILLYNQCSIDSAQILSQNLVEIFNPLPLAYQIQKDNDLPEMKFMLQELAEMLQNNQYPYIVSVGTRDTKGKTTLLQQLFQCKKYSKGYVSDGLITMNIKTIENDQAFSIVDCNSISSYEIKFYQEILQTVFAFSKIILLQISQKDFIQNNFTKNLQILLNLISNSRNDINQPVILPIFKDFDQINDDSINLSKIKENLMKQFKNKQILQIIPINNYVEIEDEYDKKQFRQELRKKFYQVCSSSEQSKFLLQDLNLFLQSYYLALLQKIQWQQQNVQSAISYYLKHFNDYFPDYLNKNFNLHEKLFPLKMIQKALYENKKESNKYDLSKASGATKETYEKSLDKLKNKKLL